MTTSSRVGYSQVRTLGHNFSLGGITGVSLVTVGDKEYALKGGGGGSISTNQAVNEFKAAAILRAIGWEDLIPPARAFARRGVFLSEYLPDSKQVGYGSARDEWVHLPGNMERAIRIDLFDGLVGNIDRHPGNTLISNDGVLYAIDHGVCAFSSRYEMYPNLMNRYDLDVIRLHPVPKPTKPLTDSLLRHIGLHQHQRFSMLAGYRQLMAATSLDRLIHF